MIHDNPELALEITSYLSHNVCSETPVMSIFLSPSTLLKSDWHKDQTSTISLA
jgi:hypothetical protein